MVKRHHFYIFAAILFAVYAVTLREGHVWGDSAHYVHHALNIVDGKPYGDTGYVLNPGAREIGPHAYPPVTPLMLAPVVAWRGVDHEALKLVSALSMSVAALVLALAMRGRLGHAGAFLLLIVFGANPVLWGQKDHVASDAPFLLWCFAALAAMDGMMRRGGGRRWAAGVGCGVLAWLAYGTRGAGIVLPAALLVTDAVRRRGLPRRSSVVAVGVFGVLASIQWAWMPAGGGYGSRFVFRPEQIVTNVVAYAKYLTIPFDGHLGVATAVTLTGVVLALAAIAVFHRMRRGITVFETFAVGYLALVVIWPGNQGVRYLVPVIPLILAWSLEGCLLAGRRLGPRGGRAAAAALSVALVGNAAAWFSSVEMAPWEDGVTSSSAQETFDWIEAHTASDAVILFRKPRCLALWTGRESSCWREGATDEEIMSWAEEIGATYVVAGPFSDCPVHRMVRREKERFRRVFKAGRFFVFEIEPSR